MNKRIAIYFIAACAITAGAGGVLTACSEDRPSFSSVDVTGANYAKDLAMTDHHGNARRVSDFKGKVVVVFFGYTQCPDVCPASMAELAEVKKALGADGDKLQGIFVTVDPERDTPEVLKGYMENFDPSFIALYTTPEKLAEVAKDFKMYYKRVEGKTPTSYTMDHSAGSYIYDTKGNLRLFTRYGSGAKVITSDIKQLLKS
ncbi:SCO family protein [Rhodoferax sp. OV413]|uniref:SCO family protein n=1 Tax=Rhodoferax sp. OV413 TaxID=1855285 RepID=UPI0025F68765|nr:SCO family protein [Rhodoferax sp. OV413]